MSASALPLEPIRVIVVDDDERMRGALIEVMTDFGFDVVGESVNGQRGVEQALALRPDVVLMDLRMPELDGIDATRRLRAEVPAAKVIVLSAYDDDSLRRAARDAGAFAYLLKGASAELIGATVCEAGKQPAEGMPRSNTIEEIP